MGYESEGNANWPKSALQMSPMNYDVIKWYICDSR